MKKMSLYEFADLINEADEWKDEFFSIIEENGWQEGADPVWDICSDGENRLEFDENGKAVVR